MSTTLVPSIASHLEEQLAYAPEGTQRVVIADGDPDLLARLDDAFPETPMVDCPQSTWRLDGSGELLDTILLAASEGITEVILSGDSLAFSSLEPDTDDWDTSEAELEDRARIAFVARQAAQVHFEYQVEALLSNSEIASLVEDGSLQITTLFYRAEADVFMVFEPSSGTFELLA